MLPSEYDAQDCSVARALEVVGERWTLLIIRDALLGVTRYDDLLARLGVPTTTLARRLNQLVEAGVLRREQYQTRPPRHEYLLTDTGRDLVWVVGALREWGDRHLAPDGPPMTFRHHDCGGSVGIAPRCKRCGQQPHLHQIEQHEHRPIRRPRPAERFPASRTIRRASRGPVGQ